MTRKFWTIVVAALFIICLSSVADAQRRAKTNRGLHAGHGQSENPGNQDENPGNGNQGETPQDPPAGTPDGETPAEEMTCDDLKHGTPGLYGLCIAFCEAHDCDPVFLDDGTLDFSSCKKNDRKLLDKYRARMKEGDPDMPCLPYVAAGEDPETACLCWSQAQLSGFPYSVSHPDAVSSWLGWELDVSEPEFDDDDMLECTQVMDYVNESLTLSTGDNYYFEIGVSTGDCDPTACRSFIGCVGGNCADADKAVEIWFDIYPDEYFNCQEQLRQLVN